MTDSIQPPAPPIGGSPPPPSYNPPPGYGAPPSDGLLPPLPWDERESLGIATALIETIKLIVSEPKDAFSRIRLDGDYVGPFLFALIVGWVMTMIGQLWNLVISSMFSFGTAGMLGDLGGMGLTAGVGVAQFFLVAVLFPFLLVIMLFIGSGIYHLCLMMVGGLEESEMGFEGTFKVACYAQVSSLANIVPLVGNLIAFILALVLAVLGFEKVHRTTTGKAAAGALIPLLLCCVCGVVIAIFFGAAIAAIAANGQL